MGKNVCAYVVTQNILYMNMAYLSILLLRKYNKTIPITLFFVQDQDKIKTTNNQLDYSTIEKLDLEKIKIASDFFVKKLKEFNVNIVLKPPYVKDDTFPHANRAYISELKEENVFFIDADTFIFDDVLKIFEGYPDNDFVALKAPWIKITNNFDKISEKFFGGLQPFCGCLLLFKNHKAKIWANSIIPNIRKTLDNQEIKEWMLKENLFLIRDEISILTFVKDNNINYAYFDIKDCCQINEFTSLERKIVHTFSHLWEKKFKKIFGKDRLPLQIN